jgi:hypothetical protein
VKTKAKDAAETIATKNKLRVIIPPTAAEKLAQGDIQVVRDPVIVCDLKGLVYLVPTIEFFVSKCQPEIIGGE